MDNTGSCGVLGLQMSRGFPEGSAKAGEQAKAGVLTNIPALGGSACDRGMLDGAAAATLFGIPRAGEVMKVAARWVGAQCELSWPRQVSSRYTRRARMHRIARSQAASGVRATGGIPVARSMRAALSQRR